MRLLRPNRLMWMAVGAAAAYYFDPDSGAARRAKLADTIAAKRHEATNELTGSPSIPPMQSSPPTESPLDPRQAPSPYQSPAPSPVGTPSSGGNDASHLGR